MPAWDDDLFTALGKGQTFKSGCSIITSQSFASLFFHCATVHPPKVVFNVVPIDENCRALPYTSCCMIKVIYQDHGRGNKFCLNQRQNNVIV